MSMIFFDLDSRVFFFQQFSNIYSHAGIKYLVYMYRYTYWQCCCCFGKWQTMPVGLENIWMWKLTIVAEDATNSRPQTIWIIAHFWHSHSHFGGAKFLVINNYADFSLHFLFWRLQVSRQTKVGYICLLTYHFEIRWHR